MKEHVMWAVNLEAAKINIEEAHRVGKCPWCCCALTEQYVYNRMNLVWIETNDSIHCIEIYPQETFEESQTRWLKEGRIDKKQFNKAMKLVKEN